MTSRPKKSRLRPSSIRPPLSSTRLRLSSIRPRLSSIKLRRRTRRGHTPSCRSWHSRTARERALRRRVHSGQGQILASDGSCGGRVTEVDAYSRLAGIYDEIVVDPASPLACFLHELWQPDEAGVNAVMDARRGTGLMAQQLVARGYRVVGVDGSAMMLCRARRLLGPTAVLIHQTLPDLTVEGVFDAAISTFDGLNHLTPAQLHATLAAISRRLRGGGWLFSTCTPTR